MQPSAGLSSQGGASFSREIEGRLTDTELRIERNRLQAQVCVSRLGNEKEMFILQSG